MSLASRIRTSGYDYLIKILFLGDYGIGKTCLVQRFLYGGFSEHPVTGDFIKAIEIPGTDKIAKIQPFDPSVPSTRCAVHERCCTISSAYYSASHAIAVCFDCSNRESFENVKLWLADVECIASPGVFKILVALKTDLLDSRVVSYDAAKAFADLHSMEYLETSAKTGSGVIELISVCAKAVSDTVACMASYQPAIQSKETPNTCSLC